MRRMIPMFNDICLKVGLQPCSTHDRNSHLIPPSQLQKALESRIDGDEPVEMDMLTWMGRTALELVGQAGLGWSFDPLVEDTVENNLGTAVKSFMYVSSRCLPTEN